MEHELQHLEAECLRIFTQYKKVQYEVQTMTREYEKIATQLSVERLLASLKSELSNKFDQLVSRLMGLKERRILELLNCEELQDRIAESRGKEEQHLAQLHGIQTDTSRLLEQIKSDFDNRRYIRLFERNGTKELERIHKRIQEWVQVASCTQLGELAADLKINTVLAEHKLSSLISISFVSRPSPEFIYDFDNENNKLLLYDMSRHTTQIINFGQHFHIPFHYSSAILGSKIFFAGGDDDGYRKDCYALSYTKNYVQKLCDLNVERRNHTLVALHIARILYCAGGYNKRYGVLASVEKYDFAQARWVNIPSLLERRQWPGLAQFNDQLIFCFGGSSLDTIEQLDILNEDKGWVRVDIRLNSGGWFARSACVAMQVNSTQILIFGGCADHDLTETVLYTPKTETIESRASLPVPSLFCQRSPAISTHYVGIIGWRNNRVYIYNAIKNTWLSVEPAVYRPSDFDSN